MGRSVSYPSGPAVVVFDHVEVEDQWEWDDYVEDIRSEILSAYPSSYEHDGWRDREDHIIARNTYVDFGVSEYGGLVSIWAALRDDVQHPDLAETWLRCITPGFERRFGSLRKVGSMSNGGGVYVRKDGQLQPDQWETKPYTTGPYVTDG